MFGESYVEVVLIGDTFDDAYEAAKQSSEQMHQQFIHPFNDPKVIEGQATVGLEIIDQSEHPIHYVFLPVGGGGLAAGVATVFKTISPETFSFILAPIPNSAVAT